MHPFLMETKSDNGWEFVHKMFNKMYARKNFKCSMYKM